jgi:hypothetical protein
MYRVVTRVTPIGRRVVSTHCRSCRRLRSFDFDFDYHFKKQDQKIAAFGSSYMDFQAKKNGAPTERTVKP